MVMLGQKKLICGLRRSEKVLYTLKYLINIEQETKNQYFSYKLILTYSSMFQSTNIVNCRNFFDFIVGLNVQLTECIKI